MKKMFAMILATVATVLVCHAQNEEIRTWTSLSGETFEGSYDRIGLNGVRIVAVGGQAVDVPLDKLSKADVEYVELKNPPELAISFLQDVPVDQMIATPWEDSGGGTHENHPIYVIRARFGAQVKQTSSKPYNHDMTVTVVGFSEQHYDKDNLHLVCRTTSKPFRLTKEKKFTFKYKTTKTYQFIYYYLSGEHARGEKVGKDHLIIVRDKLGNIIAHAESSKWLWEHHENMLTLPIGSWVDRSGQRVYPTTPKRQGTVDIL